MAIRLENVNVDAGQRRAKCVAQLLPGTARGPLTLTADEIDSIVTREIEALLRIESGLVHVRASRFVRHLTIRVPARHWEGLLTELDAVAAMLPDSAAGATVVIEDDTPRPEMPKIATGYALDSIGSLMELSRNPGEPDAEFRERILSLMSGGLLGAVDGYQLTEVAEYAYGEQRKP